MKKILADNISAETIQKFQDTSLANTFMELAQHFIDSGMEQKDIESTLKTLYGATPAEMKNIKEKLFKKADYMEVGTSIVLTDDIYEIDITDIKQYDVLYLTRRTLEHFGEVIAHKGDILEYAGNDSYRAEGITGVIHIDMAQLFHPYNIIPKETGE